MTVYRNVSFVLNGAILRTMPADDNMDLISYIKFLKSSMPEWKSVMIADWDRKVQYCIEDIWNYLIDHEMVNDDD